MIFKDKRIEGRRKLQKKIKRERERSRTKDRDRREETLWGETPSQSGLNAGPLML